MGITTFGFLCFLTAAVLVYYLAPPRAKWTVLLAASLFFIGSFDVRGLLFILLTAFSIWLAAKKIHACSSGDPAADKKKKKRILALTLVLNIGILALLKYLAPFLQNRRLLPGLDLLIPLGLSYYTLQAVSYVLDVYWKRISPEPNFGKVLLFTCYFPQMIQGPISKYKALSQEFFEKDHRFSLRTLLRGGQLMLWGFFKTMVIGEHVMLQVTRIFEGEVWGLTVLAGLFYFGVALYANFSGGIDIVRGASQCFGVELAENFRQPYFAKSLAEFWRRWHMSLGDWMKDYAFYPLSLSKPMTKLKKLLKKRVSRKMANKIAIALANVLVFLLVGVWHGFGSNFALWGLYNGLVLAFSELMEEPYKKAKTALKIRDDSRIWGAFSTLRTFFVVAIGRTTDCAATAGGALLLAVNLFFIGRTDWSLLTLDWFSALRIFLSVALLIAVSIAHEKGISIRETLEKKPFWIQALVWLLLIQFIACLGQNRTGGGFIYANF